MSLLSSALEACVLSMGRMKGGDYIQNRLYDTYSIYSVVWRLHALKVLDLWTIQHWSVFSISSQNNMPHPEPLSPITE